MQGSQPGWRPLCAAACRSRCCCFSFPVRILLLFFRTSIPVGLRGSNGPLTGSWSVRFNICTVIWPHLFLQTLSSNSPRPHQSYLQAAMCKLQCKCEASPNRCISAVSISGIEVETWTFGLGKHDVSGRIDEARANQGFERCMSLFFFPWQGRSNAVSLTRLCNLAQLGHFSLCHHSGQPSVGHADLFTTRFPSPCLFISAPSRAPAALGIRHRTARVIRGMCVWAVCFVARDPLC